MSEKGIKAVAKIFMQIQQLRGELLHSGDKQDIRMAQLLDKGKDAIKEDFCRITCEPDPKKKPRRRRCRECGHPEGHRANQAPVGEWSCSCSCHKWRVRP